MSTNVFEITENTKTNFVFNKIQEEVNGDLFKLNNTFIFCQIFYKTSHYTRNALKDSLLNASCIFNDCLSFS